MFDRLRALRKKSIPKLAPAEQASNPAPVAEAPPMSDVLRAGLAGLSQPGVAVSMPASQIGRPEPEIVAVPESIHAAEPANPDERPIDWEEEQRTDLSPRSPGRITYLLRHESPAQTKARIENDWMRVAFKRRG